jgi:hypothetical protein
VLQRFYLVLADLLLLMHVAYVAFVVFGLVLVWLGAWRRWGFVRHLWFRVAHLAAIGVVAAESMLGFVCPLTTWEDRLRLLAGGEERYEGSFLQHWLHRVLYLDVHEHAFTVAYLIFLAAVVMTFWLVPPRWPGGNSSTCAERR